MKRATRGASPHFLTALLAPMAAILFAPSAHALGEAEVRLNAYKVVTAKRAESGGTERLQPLDGVQPGDTVEYEAVYRNATGQEARDVALTIPVPAGGLAWLPGASLPKASSASVDGKVFEAIPLTRTETLPDGRRELRPVPLSEYRYLRWQLGDLPAGAVRSVRARMQLPATAAPQSMASK